MTPPLPTVPRAKAVALDVPPEGGRDVLRGAGLPGLLLTAGALAIARMWTSLKAALPPVSYPLLASSFAHNSGWILRPTGPAALLEAVLITMHV